MPDGDKPEAANGKKTGSLDVSNLLNWGDLFSAATVSGIEFALGEKPTGTKAATAVAISVVSRIITSNFTTLSSLGGNIESAETKDAFVVALINGLVAMGMKKSPAKQIAIGVAGDVLSDRMMNMINDDMATKSIFQSKST
jgi:hypothetical protein